MQHPMLIVQEHEYLEKESQEKLYERAQEGYNYLNENTEATDDKKKDHYNNVISAGERPEGYFQVYYLVSKPKGPNDTVSTIAIEKSGPWEHPDSWEKVNSIEEAEQKAVDFLKNADIFETAPISTDPSYEQLHNLAAKMQMTANSLTAKNKRSSANLLVASTENEKLLENSAATKVYDTYFSPHMPVDKLAFMYVGPRMEGPFIYSPCSNSEDHWFAVIPEQEGQGWQRFVSILLLENA